MKKDSLIYLSGHAGLAGSAILKRLTTLGYTNIIYRTSKELDLTNQQATNDFFEKEKPEYVISAAAKAGGVWALNTYRADYIYNNLMMQSNVMYAAHKNGVKKLLFFASNCLYPKLTEQPIKEEYILTGSPEPSVEFYALAKIAGIKMCQAYRDQYGCNFISALPVNLYGSANDNYDLQTGHVLPALLAKFHNAKVNKTPSVEMWGDGTARREFMHCDDLADATIRLMEQYDGREPVNIGCGYDTAIGDLARTIKKVVGYEGELFFNTEKPTGVISKLLDSSKLKNLGWSPKISLYEGITKTYNEVKDIL